MTFEHLGLVVYGDKHRDMAISLTTDIYANTSCICDPMMPAATGEIDGKPVSYFYVYAVRDEIIKLLADYGYTDFVAVKTAGLP